MQGGGWTPLTHIDGGPTHAQIITELRNTELTASTDGALPSRHYRETILNFMNDETRLILEYPRLTSERVNYICKLLSSCNMDRTDDLCVTFQRVLETCVQDHDYNLTVATNEDETSCAVLEKIPRAGKRNAEAEVSDSSSNSCEMDTRSRAEGEPGTSGTPQTASELLLPLKRIDFKLGSNKSDIDSVGDSKPVKPKYRLGRWQIKLLNDMSVPVKCNKALKMMENMGWNGGALGARGNGITEPLVPQLRMASGTGLGHTPSTSRPEPATKSAFRQDQLNLILYLLINDLDETKAHYKRQLKKKEMSFIDHALTAVNNRLKFNLSQPEETGLMLKILDQLVGVPRVRFVAFVSKDRKQFKIKKITKTHSYDEKISKSMIKDIADTIISGEQTDSRVTSDVYKTILDRLILPYGPSFYPKKTINELSFKTTILVEIMQFARSSVIERSLNFESTLTRSERAFVSQAVLQLNKRSGSLKDSFLRLVYTATQECVGKLYLDAALADNDYTVVLRKINRTLFNANEKRLCELKKDNKAIYRNHAIAYDPIFGERDESDSVEEDVGDSENPDAAEDASYEANASASVAVAPNPATPSPSRPNGKKRKNYQKVLLLPKNHPDEVLDNGFLLKIHSVLASRPTDLDDQGLKCHGICNGGLVLCCHSENGYYWLREACDANEISVLDVKRVSTDNNIKMSLKIHVDKMVNLDVDCACGLLRSLTAHNKGLRSKRWSVVGRQQSYEFNFVLLTIEIDVKSFNYLLNSGFVLNAGNYTYEFSYLCD